MAQGPAEEAREPVEARDEEVDAAGWADAASMWMENASAQIAVIEQLTKEVSPVPRSNAPSVGRR